MCYCCCRCLQFVVIISFFFLLFFIRLSSHLRLSRPYFPFQLAKHEQRCNIAKNNHWLHNIRFVSVKELNAFGSGVVVCSEWWSDFNFVCVCECLAWATWSFWRNTSETRFLRSFIPSYSICWFLYLILWAAWKKGKTNTLTLIRTQMYVKYGSINTVIGRNGMSFDKYGFE